MAYRDDREALLARTEALQEELARERERSSDAEADARKLRRDLGVLTSALGRAPMMQGPAVAKILPLIVASLVGAATLVGVNVGRTRPSSCHLAPSADLITAANLDPPKYSPYGATVHLVPNGMGTVTLDTDPPTRVLLDGHTLGLTPLTGALVPAGTHLVQLEAGDGTRVSRQVVVTEGASTRLFYRLDDAVRAAP